MWNQGRNASILASCEAGARLRAVDQFGIESAPTGEFLVRAFGPAPGTMTQGGALLLDPGQRVSMLGTEGLLLRYSGVPDYVSAGPSLGLTGTQVTSVEFRSPTDPTQTAMVLLRPRNLAPRMSLGPSHATWPSQPVEIRIELRQGDGAPLTDTSAWVPVVTVNLRPVPVTFERSGNVLLGRLTPQTGEGPWVVRVSLQSTFGLEVARDFLEVVPDPPKAGTR